MVININLMKRVHPCYPAVTMPGPGPSNGLLPGPPLWSLTLKSFPRRDKTALLPTATKQQQQQVDQTSAIHQQVGPCWYDSGCDLTRKVSGGVYWRDGQTDRQRGRQADRGMEGRRLGSTCRRKP